MNDRQFRINWKDGDLLYEPEIGQITDCKTKRRYRILYNSIAQFPISGDQWHFNPFCLTIYLDTRCSLACSYCYIQVKEKLPHVHFDPNILHEVATMIALNCRSMKKPFILGFHGGNEPLHHTETIQQCVDICKSVARQHSLQLQTYCTTSGAVSKKTAIWAAGIFNGITLSWDGPDKLHDQMRKTASGRGTAKLVRRTLAILADNHYGQPHLKVRATISSAIVEYLLEIVRFFKEYNIKYVDLLPVYQNLSQSVPDELIPKKSVFVGQFLKAKKWAKKNNMIVNYANSRLEDFHDKHCSIFQHNLTITPDGQLTSCFQATHNFQDQHQIYMYGKYDKSLKGIHANMAKLHSDYRNLAVTNSQCKDCFNYYHCSKGCPEICPINNVSQQSHAFDCKVEQWIGLANIINKIGYEIDDADLEAFEVFFEGISVKALN